MVRKKNLLKDENGVPIKYEEDDLLTSAELAQAMRSSRWTIRKWVHAGYEFEFGSKTTARHCREWLRKNKEQLKRKPRTVTTKEDARLEAALIRLRQ